MSKKFTEEQYQKILNINLNTFQIDLVGELINYLSVDGTIWGDFLNKALAIANPLTREWAHDKFVEKEKRYIWTSKNTDNEGRRIRLYKRDGDSIATTLIKSFSDELDQLTELEIREWGYNPEMFDREEV